MEVVLPGGACAVLLRDAGSRSVPRPTILQVLQEVPRVQATREHKKLKRDKVYAEYIFLLFIDHGNINIFPHHR